MAQIFGVGNLGDTPKLKYLGDGDDKKPVTEVPIYLTSPRFDKTANEWKDRGDWYDVSIWGSFAEPASKLFNKGNRVFVSGTLSTDRWPDKESGEERKRPRIDAFEIYPYLPNIESLTFRPPKSKPGNGVPDGDMIPPDQPAEDVDRAEF